MQWPHLHPHSLAQTWQTLDSPAVEVEDTEAQGGLSLHRLSGLCRATPSRGGTCREWVGVTAPGSWCRVQDRAKEPGWEGRTAEPRQRPGKKEERSECSRTFPSFPAGKAHTEPQTAPIQRSMYPNHPGDPSSSGWGHWWARGGVQGSTPLPVSELCSRMVFHPGFRVNPRGTGTGHHHTPPRSGSPRILFETPNPGGASSLRSSPSAPPAPLLPCLTPRDRPVSGLEAKKSNSGAPGRRCGQPGSACPGGITERLIPFLSRAN